MEPIAYLTVEVKHRDLEPRLLIASHLVKAGITVVVGQQWAMFPNPSAFPPGIVLFKTVNEIQALNMRHYRMHGHLVAATDEEVLQCIDDRCFLLAFSQVAAEHCDLFLAQSPAHKGAIERRYPEMAGRIAVAGSSRIDLLAPAGRQSFAAEAREIAHAHGPFILFNTNFGSINSIWRDINKVLQIAAFTGGFNKDDPASVAEFKALLAWEKLNFDALVALLDWTVKEVKNRNIVIRPHPGETVEFWMERYGGDPRVTIVPRSSPHPWIMASEMVVHTGCTTGLEAALLDRPVVNLMPSDHPTFDRIVNWANPTFKTPNEAAMAMVAFLTTGGGPISENNAKYAAVLDQYLPGYRSGDAARAIADCLREKLVAAGAQPGGGRIARYRAEFASQVRVAVTKDKFQMGRAEFTECVRLAHALTGNPKLPRIDTLDESLFMLSPA